MQNIKICPSILSANILKIEREIEKVTKQGADIIHVDIMDGHFVPNLTYGPDFLKSIRHISPLPHDVHLMLDNPDEFINKFAKAGANYISFHIEANVQHKYLLQKLRKIGVKPGIAVNPETDVQRIQHLLDFLDYVLIMTVHPGFGGQEYITDCTEKIFTLKEMIGDKEIEIEVDGGINFKTSKIAREAGANMLVSGSFIFKSENYQKTIKGLRNV